MRNDRVSGPKSCASFFDFRIGMPCPSGWEPINTEQDCRRAAANSEIFEFLSTSTPPGDTPGPLVCYMSPNQDDGIKFIFNQIFETNSRKYVCKKGM